MKILHVILLTALMVMGLAADTLRYGTLSFVLLKNGKPLTKNEIVIDGEMALRTDEDGYVNKKLVEGAHTLEVIGRENGVAQVYVKKPFEIVSGQNTQLIVTLDSENKMALEDVELPVAAAVMDEAELAALPKGELKLRIIASEDKQPIEGARIFIKGTTIEGRTDVNGSFSTELPQGVQTVSVIHGRFSTQTINAIEIAADSTTERVVEMTPSSLELEEFVVLVPHIEGSIAAMIAEEKNSDAIANIVGSQQMARQGDSNAASALKRVAGITVIGGQYIYVRGLGDRYSSTELNGMSLPSPNPVKRTVPLDMFPSGVIGSLQVQKTFTPDVTGAFGGGYVNVRTKKTSDEDYAKVKVGVKMHSTYGKEVTSYEGSESDWSGYDHSYRPFPGSFNQQTMPVVGENPPSLQYDAQQMQKLFQERNIDAKSTNVPLGGEVQVELSKNFTIADEHELSFLASYGYKSESDLVSYTSHDYIISASGKQEPEPDNTAINDLYGTTIQHGGIFNAAYSFRNFDLRYTKLYVLNTLNQTRDVNGTFGENNSKEHQYFFEWQERELNIDQVTGGLDYEAGVKHHLEFGAETAQASEYVPNDVYYNYKQYFSTSPYVFERPDSQLTYNHRTTQDDVLNFFVAHRSYLPMMSDEDYLEIGGTTESKEREGRRTEITVQSKLKDDAVTSEAISTTINDGDGSQLNSSLTSLPKDQYNATLDRNALYVKGLIKPADEVDITFGGRYVDLKQSVDQYQTEQNVVVIEGNELSFNKFLPSIGVKYAPNSKHQFRAAYSQTFIYPDFREFVDAEFIHPVFLAKVSGNPDLVETDIQSLDLRYDYYFSDTDSFSTSLFYKYMENPIEDTQEFTTSTLPRFSFDNSQSADLAGVELSWYNHLGFIDNALENLVFSGNYTYIYSKVTLTEEQKAKFVTQDRGLQGLSPQVLNISLTYEDADNRSVNLSYNKMEKRLMRVALKNGDVVLGLDDYEIPPHLVDFTWIEKFESEGLGTKMDLTFKIRNLLDGETEWVQGGKTTLTYKKGREYSLTLGAKF